MRDEAGKEVDPKDIDSDQMAQAWEEAFEDIIYVPPLKKFVRSSRSAKQQVFITTIIIISIIY